ncbi:MAG: hypothetical protein LBH44_10010 [Treponema sp.]|jgi:hypothetical protein|nr:hypothetical protein [Treponema sp.]
MKTRNRIITICALAALAVFSSCDGPLALGTRLNIVPPEITIDRPDFMENIKDTLEISGTASDDDEIVSLFITVEKVRGAAWKHEWHGERGKWRSSGDGNDSKGGWTAKGKGRINWSVSLSMIGAPSGEYLISVGAENNVKNRGAMAERRVVIDTEHPLVTVLNPVLWFDDHEGPNNYNFATDVEPEFNKWKLRDPAVLDNLHNKSITLQYEVKDDFSIAKLRFRLADSTGSEIYYDAAVQNPNWNGRFVIDGKLILDPNTGKPFSIGETDKCYMQLVSYAEDNAGNYENRSHGWLVWWPKADLPWTTGVGHENNPDLFQVYPGSKVQSGQAYDNDGVAKVAYRIFKQSTPSNYDIPVDVGEYINQPMDENSNPSRFCSWSFDAPADSNDYMIEITTSDIFGTKGTDIRYFHVYHTDAPDIKITSPNPDEPLFGNTSGAFTIGGTADDGVEVAELRLVWLKPSTSSNSRMLYQSSEYAGWNVSNGSTDSDGNKVWVLTLGSNTLNPATSRYEKTFSKTINLFGTGADNLNIGTTAGQVPLSAQSFVLRVKSDSGRYVTRFHSVKGDISPPEVNIDTVKVQRSGAEIASYDAAQLRSGASMNALEMNDKVFISGTWWDDSLDAWQTAGSARMRFNATWNGLSVAENTAFTAASDLGWKPGRLWKGTWTAALTIPAAETDKGSARIEASLADVGGNNTIASLTAQVDTKLPRLMSITSETPNGSYRIGQKIDILLDFNKDVTYAHPTSSPPTLSLNTTPPASAVYESGNGTRVHKFTYTVGSTENTPSASSLNVSGINTPSGGTWTGSGGNANVASIPQNLNYTKNIRIDNVPPIITSIKSLSGSATDPNYYNAGKIVYVQVIFNKEMKFTPGTGTVLRFNLASGGGTGIAPAVLTGNNDTLLFTYTVSQGDNTPVTGTAGTASFNYGDSLRATGITLGTNASLTDLAGNSALLTMPTGQNIHESTNMRTIYIDTLAPASAPAIAGITNGTFMDGTQSFTISGENFAKLEYRLNTAGSWIPYQNTAVPLPNGTYKIAARQTDLAGNVSPVSSEIDITIEPKEDAPKLMFITSGTDDGWYRVGKLIDVELSFNENVTFNSAGSSPTLTLSDGCGTADWVSSSNGGKQHKFIYEVESTHNSARLSVQSINSNGGTWMGKGGAAVMTSYQNLNVTKDLKIDNNAPRILSVKSSSGTAGVDNYYNLNKQVYITVTFDKPIQFTEGTNNATLLNLNPGSGSTAMAGKSPQLSGNNALLFTYTVVADNNTPATTTGTPPALVSYGDSLRATSITLGTGTNNAAITDLALNPAILTMPVGQNIHDNSDAPRAIFIDSRTPPMPTFGTPPADNSVFMYPNLPTFTLSGEGQATLEYRLNTTGSWITYTTGTATLPGVGKYEISARQTNKAGTSSSATTPINVTVEPNEAQPKLMFITSDNTDGWYKVDASKPVDIVLEFDKPVTYSGGTPTLTLSDSCGNASYVTGANVTASRHVFRYTVAAGHKSDRLSVQSINKGTGEWKDKWDAVADMTAYQNLNETKDIRIDTIAPIITSIKSSSLSGHYNSGKIIYVTATFDKPIQFTPGVTNATLLNLNAGTGAGKLPQLSGNNALLFTYTVENGNNTPATTTGTPPALVSYGDSLRAASMTLGTGASIKDQAGNDANINMPAAGGNIHEGTGARTIYIDTRTVPLPTFLTAPANNHVAMDTVGTPVTFTLSGEALATVEYQLNTGGSWFTYGGQVALPGVGKYQIAARQTNLAGTSSNATAAINVEIESFEAAPQFMFITSDTDDGEYRQGKVIDIVLEFDKPVTYSGTAPTLALNTGVNATRPATNDGNGTNRHRFTYTVGAGHNVTRLSVTSINAGGTWTGKGGTALMTISTGKNLNENKNIKIDNIAPKISKIKTSSADGYYNRDKQVFITVMFDKPIQFTQGTNNAARLNLNAGTGSAGLSPEMSGNNALMFTYTVENGNNTPTTGSVDTFNYDNSLRAESITLGTGGATITDIAGNTAVLTMPAGENIHEGDAPRTIYIDTIAPAAAPGITGIAAGTYVSAQTFTLTGLENLAKWEYRLTTNGSWNTYTNAVNLTAGTYQIAARQTDRAGNSSSVTTTPIQITIETASSLLQSFGGSPPGTYTAAAGKRDIIITLNLREAVDVSTTRPRLLLNITGTPKYAEFLDGSGSKTLRFSYTVVDGDNIALLEISQIVMTGVALTRTGYPLINLTSQMPVNSSSDYWPGNFSKYTGITIDTTRPALESQANNGVTYNEATDVLHLRFTKPVEKGAGEITLTQTTGFRAPAVLTKAEYERYHINNNTLATYYQVGTNGTSNTGTPDLSEKYILRYDINADGSNNGTLIQDVKNSGADKVVIPVVSGTVSLSADKKTMNINLGGRLPVKGVNYYVTFPAGFVVDELSHTIAALDTTDNRTITNPGVNKPFVRIQKLPGDISGTGATLATTQPGTANFKIDCQTPGTTIRYNNNSVTTTPKTGRPAGTDDGPFNGTSHPARPVVNFGTVATSTAGTTYTTMNSAIGLGATATDQNGYLYCISAIAYKTTTDTSETSFETAARSVVRINAINSVPSWGNITSATQTGGNKVQLWMRGGDGLSGNNLTPGFPLSWDDKDPKGIKLMTETGTGGNWYWITWDVADRAFIHFVLGTTSTPADLANGPHKWAWIRDHWAFQNDKFPLYAGGSLLFTTGTGGTVTTTNATNQVSFGTIFTGSR